MHIPICHKLKENFNLIPFEGLSAPQKNFSQENHFLKRQLEVATNAYTSSMQTGIIEYNI